MMMTVGTALIMSPLFYGLYRTVVRTKMRVKGLYSRIERRVHRRREVLELQNTYAEAEGLLQFEDNEEGGSSRNSNGPVPD